jgi:hypothetical protein
MVQEVQQPVVGVLGVLHQQHDGHLRGQALEEQPPSGEQFLPRQRAAGVLRERHAEEPTEPYSHVCPLGRIGHVLVQAIAQPGRGDLGGVFFSDAEPVPDDLGQRPERDALAVGQAPAPVPPDILGQPVGVLLELPAQPGLADSGRAGHQDQARHLPLDGGVE